MFWDFLKRPQIPAKAVAQVLPLEFLQKLIPAGRLPPSELLKLNTSLRQFTPGEVIFTRGEGAESILYLHSGQVYMESSNGFGYIVDASTFKACFPLSTHTEHSFSAIAKTNVQIAYLPLSVLQASSGIIINSNPLIHHADIPPSLTNNQFFLGFCAAFNRGEIQVPSLPDVALKLRNALQKDIGILDAVKIVNLDPAIASKLVQVANSPLYRPTYAISNCHDAINRLGFKTTQNLVTSISLGSLFRSKNKHLKNRALQLWKDSIHTASLSFILAEITQKKSADEALLAGLIRNIGALPILNYAETRHTQQTTNNEDDIDLVIDALQARVGEYILKKWHFPENLQHIPKQTSDWYFDDNSDLQIHDIVLLARFHVQIGNSNVHKLPPLNTLPAYHKLGEHNLTPNLSLKALHDAKQQIAESINLFRT